MVRLLLATALVLMPTMTHAQASAPSAAPDQPLPSSGVILRAHVADVRAVTASDLGAYTAFLIRPPDRGNQGWWFYIRNDDVMKSMERGAIIGLLMGAAEANAWTYDSPDHVVNIKYETIDGRRVITAASLYDRLGVPR
jgi:hypothetical protein